MAQEAVREVCAAHHAMLFTADSGTPAGHLLVIDVTGAAGTPTTYGSSEGGDIVLRQRSYGWSEEKLT